jgi:hypothetical protein
VLGSALILLLFLTAVLSADTEVAIVLLVLILLYHLLGPPARLTCVPQTRRF